MHEELHTPHHIAPSIKTYHMGYIISLVLTLVAFFIVSESVQTRMVFLSRQMVVGLVVLLAIVQLAVQSICFLHVSSEHKKRWNSISYLFTIFVVFTVVVGSLWIMYHLTTNMMPPQMLDAYMLQQ